MTELWRDLLIPDWPAPARVRACVTTRAGGVSVGAFAGLNLGDHVGDDPAAVAENRARLSACIQARPVWLSQVHGVRVVEARPGRLDLGRVRSDRVGSDFVSSDQVSPDRVDPDRVNPDRVNPDGASPDRAEHADGCWTSTPGIACTAMTADCLPVLFCNRSGTRVAAAHAGWRGLANGVLEAAVQSMATEPADIMAWLGPAIGPRRFEVGAEVREAFTAIHPEADTAFVPGELPGKFLADIYALARIRLASVGVVAVYGGGECTVEDARFFSYRRETPTGRLASLIWLE